MIELAFYVSYLGPFFFCSAWFCSGQIRDPREDYFSEYFLWEVMTSITPIVNLVAMGFVIGAAIKGELD